MIDTDLQNRIMIYKLYTGVTPKIKKYITSIDLAKVDISKLTADINLLLEGTEKTNETFLIIAPPQLRESFYNPVRLIRINQIKKNKKHTYQFTFICLPVMNSYATPINIKGLLQRICRNDDDYFFMSLSNLDIKNRLIQKYTKNNNEDNKNE